MSEVVKFVGMPDGPKVFVPEIGKEVGTFTQEPGGKHPALRYHVPLKCRGFFRPEDLANYDEAKEYRTTTTGYLLCYEKVNDGDEKRFCKRKAINRFPRCAAHGGRLHPLDMLQDTKVEVEDQDTTAMSRYQLFLAKQIGIDDLYDDEVLNFGFRGKDGRIFKPKNITREMVQAFTKATYERALDSLKANALEAVKTLTTIMMDDQVDANVRVKAATEVLDRTLGKAPQTVNLVGSAPWEEVFQGLATVTREESRRQRGLVVDGEVIEDPQPTTRSLMKELETLGDNGDHSPQG